MYWDRFDICEAYLMFGHNILRLSSGNLPKKTNVQIRRQLRKMHFEPNYFLRHSFEPKHMTTNAKAIYMQLVRKYFSR